MTVSVSCSPTDERGESRELERELDADGGVDRKNAVACTASNLLVAGMRLLVCACMCLQLPSRLFEEFGVWRGMRRH